MIDYYDQFINLEYFFYKIYKFFIWIGDFIVGIFSGDGAGGIFSSYGWLIKGLAELLVLLFLTGIIYCIIRIYEIRKEEQALLYKEPVAIDRKSVV